MKKWIKSLIALGWMGIIFIFSNEPATVSDSKSRLVIYIFKTMGLNLDSLFGDIANFIIRKCAHFTEYLIFYFLLVWALEEYFSFKKAMIVALITLILYATSDEIHQIFVLGRACRARDVLIDSLGGTTAMFIWYKIKSHKFKKKNIMI